MLAFLKAICVTADTPEHIYISRVSFVDIQKSILVTMSLRRDCLILSIHLSIFQRFCKYNAVSRMVVRQTKQNQSNQSCHAKEMDRISPNLEQGGLGPTNCWTWQPWPSRGWLTGQEPLTRKCRGDS